MKNLISLESFAHSSSIPIIKIKPSNRNIVSRGSDTSGSREFPHTSHHRLCTETGAPLEGFLC